jgi:hypothetical protein
MVCARYNQRLVNKVALSMLFYSERASKGFGNSPRGSSDQPGFLDQAWSGKLRICSLQRMKQCKMGGEQECPHVGLSNVAFEK